MPGAECVCRLAPAEQTCRLLGCARLVGNAWAPEQLCLDVLGRVVGGQLLVALKVGGTCFD